MVKGKAEFSRFLQLLEFAGMADEVGVQNADPSYSLFPSSAALFSTSITIIIIHFHNLTSIILHFHNY